MKRKQKVFFIEYLINSESSRESVDFNQKFYKKLQEIHLISGQCGALAQ
jgi:hypothetical protein